MIEEIIKIPDIGSDSAEVIEICAKVGDKVDAEDPLMVLESDKASMDVPVSASGTIVEILVKVGDTASEGLPMVKIASEGNAVAEVAEPTRVAEETPTLRLVEEAPAPQQEAVAKTQNQDIHVPDIGAENVPVIEICVKPGDRIEKEMPIAVLESDKATVEIPSPENGIVTEICISEGQEMSLGDLILRMDVEGSSTPAATPAAVAPVSEPVASAAPAPVQPGKAPAVAPASMEQPRSKHQRLHAGPAVRRIGREFGVDLALVRGSGTRGRILKEDIQSYVKEKLSQPAPTATGSGIPAVPAIDFSKFGPTREEPLNRLRKVAATNFQRSWLNVPHVTPV